MNYTQEFYKRIKLENDCWIWTGILNNKIPVIHMTCSQIRAKQFAIENIICKKYIKGQEVINTCNNILCVNPVHLIQGGTIEYLRFHGKKNGDCLEWTLDKLKSGYGRITFNKKRYVVHRLIWELINGPIPERYVICHACDNPSCFNINHLFLGTQKDNIQDAKSKNRMKTKWVTGENHPNAKLTDKDVFNIRKLYSTNKYSQKQLSVKYMVSDNTISRIVNNKYR